MGSGAAPGVPAIANGWGDCNPNNPKNRRSRTGVYLEIRSTKFLIDTSPDVRMHLLNNNIRFNKRIYSIKNLSRQSSTFLILSKKTDAFEYLKNLCNSLKICKRLKKPIKYFKSVKSNAKESDLSNYKKTSIKSNEAKIQKMVKDNIYTYSLFKKSKILNSENDSIDKKTQKHIKLINNIKLFDLSNGKKTIKISNEQKTRNSIKENIYTYSFFRKKEKENFVNTSKKRICRKLKIQFLQKLNKKE